ncbi:type VI secretion system-associated effector [Oleiphilus messinensis]|uniref:Type VI secretion system-associated effector n=1 Tax=Oleiphilus messinensis TaxID=141451 RepID=A0A1Y0IF18_9GAMM|nr:T6SS effector amidase Tae4 family protein [Oleiphilus messinensis]ARU58386.1 type VI secretion system-associated effector [Oleiphilus messinensis]
MSNPNFNLLWAQFPDHIQYPTLKDLFTHIGGTLARNINVPGFGPNGNTCAVRISRALNYSNAPISKKTVNSLKLNSITGADGKHYIFRVREIRLYLEHTLIARPIKVTRNFDKAFLGTKGIVAFSVNGWSDASGHVALWDGTTFKEPKFDDFRDLKDDPATLFREPNTEGMTLWPL